MAGVRLRPMREDEYSVWYDAALETYAKEHAA